jgi:pilus assembly protein CpaE
MTSSQSPIRVVAIGEPGPTQEQITTALTAQPEFALVEVLTDLEKLPRVLRAAEPNILLIDHRIGGQPSLDIIDDLAQQFPEAAVVAILPGEDPLAAQQVMLAGARAFLIQPFTQVNLLSTLRRVRDLEARRRQAQPATPDDTGEASQPLRTLAVYSPRGGAGCSTLAINLAIAMLEATHRRVLLVDGKLFFGHLGMMLNLRARNTLADLIPHAARLDAALIDEVIVEHATGLHVLLGPSDVQAAQGIRPQDLFTVLEGLQRVFDLLVIDVGSTLNENSVTMLDAADRILLVINPELAALHDTSRFIQVSHTLSYPPAKLAPVLNRAGMPGGLRSHDVVAALHQDLFAQVPEAGPNALRSLNRGIPLLLKYPRNPASRAIQQLARQLLGLNRAYTASRSATAKDGKVKSRARSVAVPTKPVTASTGPHR